MAAKSTRVGDVSDEVLLQSRANPDRKQLRETVQEELHASDSAAL